MNVDILTCFKTLISDNVQQLENKTYTTSNGPILYKRLDQVNSPGLKERELKSKMYVLLISLPMTKLQLVVICKL